MSLQIMRAVALMEAFRVLVWCKSEPDKYLFISMPHLDQVSYVRMPSAKPLIGRGAPKWHVQELRGGPGPGTGATGLAVDQIRKILYVAAPKKRAVLGYRIKFNDGQAFVDGREWDAVTDVQTHWIACDGLGSLFLTDEEGGQILKVHAEDLLAHKPNAKVIYNSASITKVSSPGGIAVDNFHVYWGNKVLGTQAGSVVKGFEMPANPAQPDPESVRAIATNADKVYGVCLVEDSVFFSVPKKVLYGVDKSGITKAAEVHSGFHSPRGCVWDGEGTVFVADWGANSVLQFAGNMKTPGEARVSKLVDVASPFDVAVMSRAGLSASWTMTLLVAVVTGFFNLRVVNEY